ncbi:amino acid aminotransferase [Rhodovulum sp. FJ3]|uniref:amino acid aminotransferase n=1 Tax=Rhodovulum sp. FJ3 TaxID=3079053 RepID=UPI00293DEA4D|nr:amino acid aminotransferase [Rhodovulum sp. FJ3]MDV4168789.1 amino acid aminotransferase [Rhodovulum sp. FJ3]
MTPLFDRLQDQPADAIIGLMRAYAADPRPSKIDLGVGVFKTPEGLTPIPRAIAAAERRVMDAQTTKTYTDLAGDITFRRAMSDLVLGADYGETPAIGTVGGTGAMTLALDLIRGAVPTATIWVPTPTWPNHLAIIRHRGLPLRPYRYAENGVLDLDGMLADLSEMKEGDAIILHGCCHNPTGIDPTPEDWRTIATLIAERGATPVIDLAYQGFGTDLDTDAAATRLIAKTCPNTLIAASCSKNFGLYRERAGTLIATCHDTTTHDRVQGTLTALNRLTYSFPPDHGARLVSTVLTNPDLRADWIAELSDMRTTINDLRTALADALRLATNSDRFDAIATQRGMFSRLGLTPDDVVTLREHHGIYMVGDSRINIAGLTHDTIPTCAAAIAKTLR